MNKTKQNKTKQNKTKQNKTKQKYPHNRSVNKINVPNRTIFNNDNLEVLQGINSDCIDLVYLDPPFNKKKTFTAPIGSSAEGASFKDIFTEEDIKEDWIKTIAEDNSELYSLLEGVKMVNGGGKSYNYWYLVYMAMRLIECHRVLKDTGSLYLHCDPTMSHYLKLLLDCIFDEKNFRNEIVWKKTNSPKSQSKQFGAMTDNILFYTKSNKYEFNKIYMPHDDESMKPFSHKDNIGKFQTVALSNKTGQGGFGKMKVWEWKGVKARWIYSKEKLENWWNEGRIYTTRTGKYRKKEYLRDSKGKLVSNLFVDDEVRPVQGVSKEYNGYPTQKPLKLLQRIIEASSNKGDVVLDPFCGCATTCVASEILNRNWIGIDISVEAYNLVKDRLEKEVTSNIASWGREITFLTYPPKRTDHGKYYVDEKYVYIAINSDNTRLKDLFKVGISLTPKDRLNSAFDPFGSTKIIYSVLKENYRETEKYIHDKYPRIKEWVIGADLETLKKEINEYTYKKPEQLGIV